MKVLNPHPPVVVPFNGSLSR